MANEFENLELKDENTGEIESFTPVDTTARQQIEELNETLTEVTQSAIVLNEGYEAANNLIYKLGPIVFFSIQLVGFDSTGNSSVSIGTVPEGMNPRTAFYGAVASTRTITGPAFFQISNSGEITMRYNAESGGYALISGAYLCRS